MIVDRAHRSWGLATAGLAVAAGILYVLYARAAPSGPRGGSWPGLAFGGAGTALMVFAALLGFRRKHPSWRVGRASSWLKGHIWLGALTVPLILFHADFSLGGPLTIALMALLAAVTISGVVGLVLQQFVPRLMTEQAPLETIYEEIPHVCEQLRAEADALVSGVCGDLGLAEEAAEPAAAAGAPAPPPSVVPRAGVPATVQPAAAASSPAEEPTSPPSPGPAGGGHGEHGPPRPPTPEEAAERKARHRAVKPEAAREAVEGSGPLRDFYLARIRAYLGPDGRNDRDLSRKEVAKSLFERLRTLVPPVLGETLDDLHSICEERRQLYVQARLHGLLHGWLLVHVPLTMALLVLTALHAVWSLRY